MSRISRYVHIKQATSYPYTKLNGGLAKWVRD